MCGKAILPADLSNHPRCHGCSILLEPEFDGKTLCRCGKYHNARASPIYYCRCCLGRTSPRGTPKGEPVRIEAEEED
jgi:hypothetical protein